MSVDRWLIMETLNSYAWGYDQNDMQLMGNSFTEDAFLSMEKANGEVYEPSVGRDAIVTMLGDIRKSQSDQRRHCISNFIFNKIDENSAQVISYLVVTAAENNELKLATSGKYTDELVKEKDGQWRIKKKHIFLDVSF